MYTTFRERCGEGAEGGNNTERLTNHTGHQSAAMVRIYTRRADAFSDHAASESFFGMLKRGRTAGAALGEARVSGAAAVVATGRVTATGDG